MSLLKLLLSLGNYLNADTNRGNCVGFMMNSLIILDGVKGKDKITLLDFLIMNIKSQDPSLLTFPKDFLCLDSACEVNVIIIQIDQGDLESKVRDLETGYKKLLIQKEALTKEIKFDEENIPFKESLNELEIESFEKIEKLKKLQETSKVEIIQTAISYGEDPKTFKFNEFIKIIFDFIKNFKKSNIKISAEEAKELKKQIKEGKKTKPNVDNKILNDLQNMRKDVVRKTQARKTHLKKFQASQAILSKENTPIIINQEENLVPPKSLNDKINLTEMNTEKNHIPQERITNFGGKKEEDFDDIDEEKAFNTISQNTTKSKIKIK